MANLKFSTLSLFKVCCDWREIAINMRERVFEQQGEQLIDINDVKVLFYTNNKVKYNEEILCLYLLSN